MSQLSEDELKSIAQAKAPVSPEVGTIWRHFKGGLYVVWARSIQEDTLEPLITYRSNARGTFWTRTVANFTEWVPVIGGCDTGGSSPRFRRVED